MSPLPVASVCEPKPEVDSLPEEGVEVQSLEEPLEVLVPVLEEEEEEGRETEMEALPPMEICRRECPWAWAWPCWGLVGVGEENVGVMRAAASRRGVVKYMVRWVWWCVASSDMCICKR